MSHRARAPILQVAVRVLYELASEPLSSAMPRVIWSEQDRRLGAPSVALWLVGFSLLFIAALSTISWTVVVHSRAMPTDGTLNVFRKSVGPIFLPVVFFSEWLTLE